LAEVSSKHLLAGQLESEPRSVGLRREVCCWLVKKQLEKFGAICQCY